MEMAYTKRPDDGLNAVQRYQAKCDTITIRPLKEKGEAIRRAAAERGYDSLTRFVVDAIDYFISNGPAD